MRDIKHCVHDIIDFDCLLSDFVSYLMQLHNFCVNFVMTQDFKFGLDDFDNLPGFFVFSLDSDISVSDSFGIQPCNDYKHHS